jgi:hypothetical protein
LNYEKMKDREFENYLALLSGMLRLRRTQREGIAGELRDHLVEHVAHLEASGSSHEEAVRRALEEFGDAAALAANFSALVGMRRRRLVMRCTIGTTVVMTGLVVAMLAFRPPVIDDPSIVQAQAGGSDSKATKSKAKSEPSERIAISDSDARHRLHGNKISAEFVEVPVSVALAYISDKVGVQFYIDKHSLESANVSADTPTTLNLKSVPAEMVLDLILRQAKLGYRLRNGVILVASAEDVQSQTEVRVYRVPDGMAEELAALIPDTIDAQLWSGHSVITDPRGRRRAGYGATGMYGGGYGSGSSRYGSTGGYGATAPGEGESVETVGGGGAGTIRVFRGTLVISQTPEVHQRIEKLLNDLAGAGAMEPQRRPDGPGGERTGFHVPGASPQETIPGEGGYGQAGQPGYGQTGRGQSGYGSTGRGGFGTTGGSRGGYGATSQGRGGYGATGASGYGQGPSSPTGNSPGRPPSSGPSAPATGTAPGPTAPGGQPPGTVDPNAAGPNTGSPPPGLPPELKS